ncbi:MAG TPA: hypothetical protein VKX49_26945 [Bryobacteraceae bacterium]|nr:hypothetical protein [Bryobacteraceae bacterium]
MRKLCLSVFSIVCGLSTVSLPAPAQSPSDVFDKAPPAIDEALRTRVEAFYQAHVDGKFRQADQYVAEDSKDFFFAAEKTRYHGFNISKITYSDNFTKATVMTACKTELAFHGQKMPVTMPAVTHWKVENGEWFWYHDDSGQVDSPWGKMKAGPESENPVVAMIPRDPAAAARSILSKITVDASEVTIDETRSNKREIHLKNGSLGPITVSADPTGMPGLTVVPAKSQVGPGEEIAIVIQFNFDDPAINCKDCLVHPGVRPPITVNLHTQPIQQDFPIKITFTQTPQN